MSKINFFLVTISLLLITSCSNNNNNTNSNISSELINSNIDKINSDLDSLDSISYELINSDLHSITSNESISKASTINSENFTISEDFFSYGTDMSISTGGVVKERTMNWTKTFEYFDKHDKFIAKAKEEVFTYYTNIIITDEFNNKIGSVEQEIMESMFSISSIYSIKDVSGNIIAKSKKLDFFTTDITINDNNGGYITIEKEIFTIGDDWDISIHSNIDKRLIIFIPGFITSTQRDHDK